MEGDTGARDADPNQNGLRGSGSGRGPPTSRWISSEGVSLPTLAPHEHPEPCVNRASLSTQPGPPSGAGTRDAFHGPPHRGDQPEKPHTLISALQSRVSAGATDGQGLRRPQGPGNGLAAPVPSLRPRGTAIRERRFSFFFSTPFQSILPSHSRNPFPGLATPAGCRPAAQARPAVRPPGQPRLCFAHLFSSEEGRTCGSEMTLVTRDTMEKSESQV